MKVAIVGGTGFIGDYLVDALAERRHDVRLLVRAGSESRARASAGTHIPGDWDDAEALASLMAGCDAAIFAIGILRENRRRNITFERLQYDAAVATIEAAKAAGVTRFLLMSANGVRPGGTPYQDTKYRAEQAALASGLAATVFRPSVVFGDPHGKMEIATQLLGDMVRPPIPAADFFSLAKGRVRMSPVHAADVAAAFAAALADDGTAGKCIELGGPEVLTWGEMIRRVAAACGRSKWLVPVPIELMMVPAMLLDRLQAFPVTRDQLRMLAEGNIAAPAPLEALIGREPRAFAGAELAYLAAR